MGTPRLPFSKDKFLRITWVFEGTGIDFDNSTRLAGSLSAAGENPKTRRAPERRAMDADLSSPWKSIAKSKAEARSRRNCWRGARSVSPDINPRLRAFVSTSMRRSKIGLSLKISEERRSTTQEISAFGMASLSAAREGRVWMTSPILPSFTIRIRISVGQLSSLSHIRNKHGQAGCLSYLRRRIISEVE